METKVHPKLARKIPDGNTWDNVLKWITAGYSIGVTSEGHHVLVGPKVVYGEVWTPEASTQPQIKPRMCILHTNAGPRKTPWRNLYNHIFRKDVVGEMHFQADMDGTIANLMPLNRRADCNYSANSFRIANDPTLYGAISFETQDEGWPTLNTTPWTVPQLESMIAAITCICVVYGVYCTQPAKWDDSGIGHHSLFPYGGLGSKAWTNVRGKTCPGTARIRQMDYVRARVAKNLADFGQVTGWKCGT